MNKLKTILTGSFLLSAAAVAISYYNYNGQLSNQYRGTDSVIFGIIVGLPTFLAICAFILGVIAFIIGFGSRSKKDKDYYEE